MNIEFRELNFTLDVSAKTPLQFLEGRESTPFYSVHIFDSAPGMPLKVSLSVHDRLPMVSKIFFLT